MDPELSTIARLAWTFCWDRYGSEHTKDERGYAKEMNDL